MGYQFSTYAYWWIRQGIQREIAVARSIRVPFHWQEKSSAVKKTVKTLIQTLEGRSPSILEIAKYMNEEISWVEEVLLHGRPIASLNFQFKGEGEELLSLVADADGVSASDIIDRSIMRDRLYSVIDSLVKSDKITDEELNVLVRFYGLHGVPIETLKQQALGNEKERALLQKVKNKAIDKLRTFPVRRQLTHLI
jgi:DNA-directed RNA polymerase sigma subunit (sigma70/sigma32)